jgi:hypothetical protein
MRRIAQESLQYSRASTHLSEYDLLTPVGQPPRKPSNIGPPPAEEDELEYVDPPTERIPRQPIAPDPAFAAQATAGCSKFLFVSKCQSLITTYR